MEIRSQLVPPVLTKNTDILKQEVHEHIAADSVVQGTYWQDGKGCFIGCLTHCNDPAPAVERFGLTASILRIAERIFESLPPEEAKAFFYEFPSAVGCDSKDLSLVHWKFLAETLRNLPSQHPENQAVINTVITGIDSLASGGSWATAIRAAVVATRDAAWDAARDAAWSAVGDTTAIRATAWATETAAAVAKAAAWSAWSTRATRAAAAEAAAEAGAWSAGDATASARATASAGDAETRRQRDSLLRLIREAPVVTPREIWGEDGY